MLVFKAKVKSKVVLKAIRCAKVLVIPTNSFTRFRIDTN